MIIGGYMPMTLSDYPGHVASVVFAQGCNFRCPFCHNGTLIPAQPLRANRVPEQHVFEHLEERRLHLQGVVITGGEPTLQSDLPEFARRVKEIGLKVKLDTNGSRPEVLEALIEQGLVDFVAMDVKSHAGLYDVMAGVSVSERCIRDSIDIVANSGLEHIFRTTLVPELMDAEDLIVLRDMIPLGSFHVEQEFRREDALDPSLRRARQVTPSVRVGV